MTDQTKRYLDNMHKVIEAYLAIYPERTLHYLPNCYGITAPEWEEMRLIRGNENLMRSMLSELSEMFTAEAVAMGWETAPETDGEGARI